MTDRSVGRGFLRLLSVLALLLAVAAAPMGRADAAPPGDPPGNNGTVKIERDGPADEDPEPGRTLRACWPPGCGH